MLDDTDRAILAAVARDGRVTNRSLAELVHLSQSACLARVRRLEDIGVITGWHARIDPRALGARLIIFLHLSFDGHAADSVLADLAASRPEIVECHMVAGEEDYLLKLRVADMPTFNAFYADHIAELPGLTQSRTRVALRTVLDS